MEWQKRLGNIHLTPTLEAQSDEVWTEWKEYLKEINYNGENMLFEEYYVIQKGNNILGVVWLEELNNELHFALYTMERHQGLRIGENVIEILRSFGKQLVLATKEECSVVDYYLKKASKNTLNLKIQSI